MDSLTTAAATGLVLLIIAILALVVGAVAVLVYHVRYYLINRFTRKTP